MIRGETIGSGALGSCCGQEVKMDVCRSAAGYYVGTVCRVCLLPYSRESIYYPTAKVVERHIREASWSKRS